MEETIQDFIRYIRDKKKASNNTQQSYERDLRKAMEYFRSMGITCLSDVTPTDMNAYIFYMEKKEFSPASISRTIVSLKKFFQYLHQLGDITEDPTRQLKAPRVEKKITDSLSIQEVELLLAQPDIRTPKGIRDKAMIQLLYSTGIGVSEMIALTVSSVNLELGYVICKDRRQERICPFEHHVGVWIRSYLENRESFLKEETDSLFLNRSGKVLTRQGVWKLIKEYAKKAGIQKEITPHMIRHSFAIHLLQSGYDVKQVQERFGQTMNTMLL